MLMKVVFGYRVAIVGHQGKTVYDTFVHVPPVLVKDYCTSSSGVRAEDLVDGELERVAG